MPRNLVPRALREISPTRYWSALFSPSQASADKIIAKHTNVLWDDYGVRFVRFYDPDSQQSQNQKQKRLVAMSDYTHNESHVPRQTIRASDIVGKPYLFSEKKSVQVQRRTQAEVTSELEANHASNRL